MRGVLVQRQQDHHHQRRRHAGVAPPRHRRAGAPPGHAGARAGAALRALGRSASTTGSATCSPRSAAASSRRCRDKIARRRGVNATYRARARRRARHRLHAGGAITAGRTAGSPASRSTRRRSAPTARRSGCTSRPRTSRRGRCGSRCTCSRSSRTATSAAARWPSGLFRDGLCLPSGSSLTPRAGSSRGLRPSRKPARHVAERAAARRERNVMAIPAKFILDVPVAPGDRPSAGAGRAGATSSRSRCGSTALPPAWAIDAFWQMLPWLRADPRPDVHRRSGSTRGCGGTPASTTCGRSSAPSPPSTALFYGRDRQPARHRRSIRDRSSSSTRCCCCSCSAASGSRAASTPSSPTGESGRRVLIFGAGDAGELIVRDMKTNREYGYQPVGFIDDDPAKVGRRIHGVPVLGTRAAISRDILRARSRDEVLIAIPERRPGDHPLDRPLARAVQDSDQDAAEPARHHRRQGRASAQIRNLRSRTCWRAPPVGLDPGRVKQLIAAGASWSPAPAARSARSCAARSRSSKPASLVMFERYENSLHAIRLELEDQKPAFGAALRSSATSTDAVVRRARRCSKHRPEIVFHAAAHKHVPLMEENPCEAIKNNVRGTRLLAQAAELHGVDRFILISTDKAVNPTSVMGASKRLAELIVQTQAVGSGTSFSRRPVRQRARQQRQRGAAVPRADPRGRAGHGHPPGDAPLLHADSRGRAARAARRVAGRERRRSTCSRWASRSSCVDMARDLIRLAGFVPDEDIPIDVHRPAAGREAVRRARRHRRDRRALTNREDSPRDAAGRSRIPTSSRRSRGLRRRRPKADVAGVRESLKRLIPEYTNPVDMPAAQARDRQRRTGRGGRRRRGRDRPGRGEPLYQYCPSCVTARMHRSRARNLVERVRRNMIGGASVPLRQRAAGAGWLMPLVSIEGEPAAVRSRRSISRPSTSAVVSPPPAPRRRILTARPPVTAATAAQRARRDPQSLDARAGARAGRCRLGRPRVWRSRTPGHTGRSQRSRATAGVARLRGRGRGVSSRQPALLALVALPVVAMRRFSWCRCRCRGSSREPERGRHARETDFAYGAGLTPFSLRCRSMAGDPGLRSSLFAALRAS